MDDDSSLPHPGVFIKKALEERGLTQNDLAFILGMQQQGINQIVTGKRGLSPDMAMALGQVFSVTAEYLMRLQKAAELRAQLPLAKAPDPSVARKTRLVTAFPVREMIKRGWLRDEPETLEDQVSRFFGIQTLDDAPALVGAAFKSSTSSVTPAQLAWLYRVKQMAEDMLAPSFDDLSAPRAIEQLDKLLGSAESIRKVPKIMAECGIRYVVVEQLPGSKIDGACFWLNERTPVIGMSLRYDRIDNFWFVLRHELEHVRLRHGVTVAMIDAELEGERAGTGDSVEDEERLANAAAANFCVPQAKMVDFIRRKAPIFSETNIIAFARTLNLHPGLVAGQLQRHTGRYDLFRKHQVKVRSIVAPGSMIDGWGDVAQIGN